MNETVNESQVVTRIDLTARYPRSIRYILFRSFWYLLALGVATLGWLRFSIIPGPGFQGGEQQPNNLIVLCFGAILLICIVKIAYEYVYHWMFSYGVELEHLTITKGVFFRSRSSFPIAKINDVTMQRTPLEMVLFLQTLNVLTASSAMSTFGQINGLPRKSAIGLQAYLLALIESTLPNMKESAAEEVVSEVASSEDTDEIPRRKAVGE